MYLIDGRYGMAKKNKNRISFDEYYTDLFEERWPLLRESLGHEPSYYELKTSGPDQREVSYFLDEASFRTALLVQPDKEDSVLDMCAAPGGKSLSILSSFPDIRLTANEWSGKRRDRLKKVFEQHLAEDERKRVKVTGFDARTWFRHEKNMYDRILLDVPCSSEKHVINSPRYYSQWTPSRTSRLAIQAFAMLASALEVVKPGGRILYSTCALSPLENDGVLEKLHKKRAERFEIIPVRLPFGEKTRYGWQVFPDTSEGRGPMYAACVHRIS